MSSPVAPASATNQFHPGAFSTWLYDRVRFQAASLSSCPVRHPSHFVREETFARLHIYTNMDSLAARRRDKQTATMSSPSDASLAC